MTLVDFLNSINENKVNLIRISDSPLAAEKLYPAYAVQRCMSLHQDTVLYANELNIRGLASFGLSNRQQYEFFLYSVKKKKRFAKWEKPEKEEIVEKLKEIYRCSVSKAREIQQILTEEQIDLLIQQSEAKGGDEKRRTRTRKTESGDGSSVERVVKRSDSPVADSGGDDLFG